jgi:hypothetical protein
MSPGMHKFLFQLLDLRLPRLGAAENAAQSGDQELILGLQRGDRWRNSQQFLDQLIGVLTKGMIGPRVLRLIGKLSCLVFGHVDLEAFNVAFLPHNPTLQSLDLAEIALVTLSLGRNVYSMSRSDVDDVKLYKG